MLHRVITTFIDRSERLSAFRQFQFFLGKQLAIIRPTHLYAPVYIMECTTTATTNNALST